ncbi:tetratricopeptide repeat protein [Paenibacillus campi]|uniref:tetratricopeptide repeat protein n=1 Tax=Paenibacillus campi TaxID=3106031 RepID=UPI002AFEB6EA|nr:tetratricopeptide repeat protein [Paenibacillus sp. SGZ-1014]
MNSTLEQSIQHAAELRSSGQAAQAKQLLEQLLLLHPDQPDVLYQLAWTCDNLGLEREAVPYYEQALQHGLTGEDRPDALLGLGSTYRTLGRYADSEQLLRTAIAEYPQRRELHVFYAMTLYNLGRSAEAIGLLLEQLAATSSDVGITQYGKAIRFYADKLDQVWT